MTAFDRAFIRAYRPQDAAALQSATSTPEGAVAAPTAVAAAEDFERRPEPAPVARPTIAARSSVLAALEQPFRVTLGTVRSSTIGGKDPRAADSPTEESAAAEASVLMEAAPSPAADEPAAAKRHGPKAMCFASYTRHREASEPAQTPLPTHEPPHDVVAPTVRSAAVAPPCEPVALGAHAVAASDPLAKLRSPLQDGFDLSSLPFDATYAPSAAATAADTAAIVPEPVASDMALPPPAIPSPDEPRDARFSPPGATLRPAWQVEQFSWPKMCRRIFARAGEDLDRLADALIAAGQRGEKVLAIGGWHYGEGATTLLLCAARRLAERGIRPVLVDADVERPRLARRLGVQPQAGWNQAAADSQGTSLEQVLVAATVNSIALVPACETAADGDRADGDRSRLAKCLETLRPHYDLVLVDLGPLESVREGLGSAAEPFGGIDAVVLVRDERLTSPDQLREIQRQLTSAGVRLPGIIENFVDR